MAPQLDIATINRRRSMREGVLTVLAIIAGVVLCVVSVMILGAL